VDEYLNMQRSMMEGGEGGASSVGRGGLAQSQRLVRTRREAPALVTEAHERLAKERMNILPGEAWSWRRYSEEEILAHAGNFKTLRRAAALVAGALGEGRTGSLARQHAFLTQALTVLEAASKDPQHDLAWAWPLLGIPDPDGRPRTHMAPAEAQALAAFHRDEAALVSARKALDLSTSGQAASTRAEPTTGSVSPRAAIKAEVIAELKRQRQSPAQPKGGKADGRQGQVPGKGAGKTDEGK